MRNCVLNGAIAGLLLGMAGPAFSCEEPRPGGRIFFDEPPRFFSNLPLLAKVEVLSIEAVYPHEIGPPLPRRMPAFHIVRVRVIEAMQGVEAGQDLEIRYTSEACAGVRSAVAGQRKFIVGRGASDKELINRIGSPQQALTWFIPWKPPERLPVTAPHFPEPLRETWRRATLEPLQP